MSFLVIKKFQLRHLMALGSMSLQSPSFLPSKSVPYTHTRNPSGSLEQLEKQPPEWLRIRRHGVCHCQSQLEVPWEFCLPVSCP